MSLETIGDLVLAEGLEVVQCSTQPLRLHSGQAVELSWMTASQSLCARSY